MVGGPPSHSAIKRRWGPRHWVRGSPRRHTPHLQTLIRPEGALERREVLPPQPSCYIARRRCHRPELRRQPPAAPATFVIDMAAPAPTAPVTSADGANKNAHLKTLEGAGERFELLKADLLDYNSVASAVAGCEGVFHVASPVPSGRSSNPEVEVIGPAVTGTTNVLKACYEAKVGRVVVVSSVSAVFSNPNWPKGKPFDEDCWSDEEDCRKNEDWYYLSKTLAEREAFAYGAKTGLDVVTICPSLVFGPLMQPTVNSSSKILLNYFKGDRETVENRLRNIVDVRDVADALLLAYEKPEASGRYICNSPPIKVFDMINILKNLYPTYPYPKNFVEVDENSVCSSEKLQKLGWTFRPIEETLHDSVESYKAFGFLN